MLDYYSIAKLASSKVENHEGLIYIKSACKTAERILDVGCGEGTRLNNFSPNSKKSYGVDASNTAITQAKKQYPRHNFTIGKAENLPYADCSFDLVYSAFTLEHVENPMLVISEIIRVCKKGGQVVLVAPNFGSPNRRSPNSVQNPLKKLLQGFISDLFMRNSLSWQAVTPKSIYNQIDDDTTVEPYILSLINYLRENLMQIVHYSSLWSLESNTINPRKLLFKYLGLAKVYPFVYWGPQIFVAARKIS